MKAGDKVVCVDPSIRHPEYFSELPKKDTVYVVREARNIVLPGLLLVGIVGDWCHAWNCEYGFRASRFRLVSEVGHPPIEVAQLEELSV